MLDGQRTPPDYQNFSRRQYISQFEKWGTHKYKTLGKDARETAQNPSRGLQSQSVERKATGEIEDNSFDLAYRGQESHTKRQRSLHDHLQIPAKRQILTDYRLLTDPVVPFRNLEKPSETLYRQPSIEYSDLPEVVINDSLDQPNQFNAKPNDPFSFENFDAAFFLQNDSFQTLSDENFDDNLLYSDEKEAYSDMDTSNGSLINDIFERWATNQQSEEGVFQHETQFDINRPIDTFSPSEMEDMKRAADFLFALDFRKDAFGLYVLILKRLRSYQWPTRPPSSALVACVRSAVFSHQAAIARSLLMHQLEDQRTVPIEEFTFQMLLADTYTRFNDHATANFHIRKAMQANPLEERLVRDLPQDYRTLDLITYHCIVDGIIRSKSPRADDTLPPNYFSMEKTQVQIQMLRRVPGPFEIDQGAMRNRCIRSCLEWCTGLFVHDGTIPGLWNTAHSKHYSKLSEDRMDWTRVYCYLWQIWQSTKNSLENSELGLWTQSEQLMGISAAEHLVIICPLIMNAAPPRVDFSEWDLFLRARTGLSSLCARSDKKLGARYLDIFSSRNSWQQVTEKEVPTFTNPITSDGTDATEKNLAVTLLLSQMPQSTSLDIVAATLLPTMVSKPLDLKST